MPAKRTALLALATIAAIAQLYPVGRDNPSPTAKMEAPPDVDRILRRSCYDCHSNETRWPWYSYVAPASWLVTGDVHEARQHMNFSAWPESLPPGADCHFKRRIAERADKSEMPPLRYRLLHPSAALTEEDRALLSSWATYECAQNQ